MMNVQPAPISPDQEQQLVDLFYELGDDHILLPPTPAGPSRAFAARMIAALAAKAPTSGDRWFALANEVFAQAQAEHEEILRKRASGQLPTPDPWEDDGARPSATRNVESMAKLATVMLTMRPSQPTVAAAPPVVAAHPRAMRRW
jgi:hypothetical protein